MGRMNADAAVQTKLEIVRAPVLDMGADIDPQLAPPKKPMWVVRRCRDFGFITMAEETSTPPPGVINWTRVSGTMLYLALVAGLWYFTWQAAEQNGIRLEKARSEREQLEKQMAVDNAAKQKQIDELKKQIELLKVETGSR